MVLRDIYNVVGVAAQDTFFSEKFSRYRVICDNTGMFYHQGKNENEIVLGGYYNEPMNKDWVLGLSVVGIGAVDNHVMIYVDG